MMTGKLPITLPINATEDRVIGDWKLAQLLEGKEVWQQGLLEQADEGFLYVDEVNLLDDHIVNLLLDASSTGILPIQRSGKDETIEVNFGLIGTMNPEEGQLRPQLLDRFGLCVHVNAETEKEQRRQILEAVLEFDKDRNDMTESEKPHLKTLKTRIDHAKERVAKNQIIFSVDMAELCAELAQRYEAEGHRGEHVLALAAQAYAALERDDETTEKHIQRVAQMAFQHRLIDRETRERGKWSENSLQEVLDARQQ